MSRGTGQMLRLGGMVIEAVSVFLLLGVRRGDVGLWKQTGLDPSVVLPAAFLVGLATWVTGTLALSRHRKRQERDL